MLKIFLRDILFCQKAMGAVLAKSFQWLKDYLLSIKNSVMPKITNHNESDNEEIVEDSSSDSEVDQDSPLQNLRPLRSSTRLTRTRRRPFDRAENLQNRTINQAVVEHAERRAKDQKSKEEEALKKEQRLEAQKSAKENLDPEPETNDSDAVTLLFRADEGRVLQRRFSRSTSTVASVFEFLCSEGYHEEEIAVRRHDKTNLFNNGEKLRKAGIVNNECFYISRAVQI